MCCDDVVGMTNEVGRQQEGRESFVHSSTRRERDIPPTRKRGKLKEVSSTTENQPEPVPELEIYSEPNLEIGEHEDMKENELEVEEEQPEEEEEQHEDEEEQPPPPSPPCGSTKFLVNSWTHTFSSGFKRPTRI
jgi:hypothetical protein